MPSEQRIQQQWVEYAERVIPKGAPTVQIVECRRAFFAGAVAFHSVMLNGLSGCDDITSADEAMMLELDAELRQFNEDVKEGRA